MARGDVAFAVGKIVTTRANWLRLSSCFRTVEVFLAVSDAQRKLEQMRACWLRYSEHMSPEEYFLRAFGVTAPMPVGLCIDKPSEHLKHL